LGWQWNTNADVAAEMQATNGVKFVHNWRVQSLQNCSACHR
jgi:mono/diheme cytochrome c family protein